MTRSIRLEAWPTTHATDWFGSTVHTPVRAADTGGRLSVQIAHLPPGSSSPPHCHGSEDEVFHVIRGSLLLETPGERVELGPGDLAVAPRGLTHRVSTGDEPCEVLILITPGALEEAFDRIAADPSPTHLRREMRVWGVELLDDLAPFDHPLAPDPGPLRVVRHGEGEPFWLAGDEYTISVPPELLGNRLCVMRFLIPPGAGPLVHVHAAEEEIFHVIRGDVSFYADGTVLPGRPGDTAVLPRGIPHCFRNTGETEAEFLTILTPAGFDRFVRRVGRPAIVGRDIPAPDPAELTRLEQEAGNFGLELYPGVVW